MRDSYKTRPNNRGSPSVGIPPCTIVLRRGRGPFSPATGRSTQKCFEAKGLQIRANRIDTAGQRRNVNADGSRSEPCCENAPMVRRPIPFGGTRDEKSRPKGRRIRSLWWTRTRRIRTTAFITIEVPILETRMPPIYQRIAVKAKHLHELGLSQSEIGRRVGVDRWTVGKALRWITQPKRG